MDFEHDTINITMQKTPQLPGFSQTLALSSDGSYLGGD